MDAPGNAPEHRPGGSAADAAEPRPAGGRAPGSPAPLRPPVSVVAGAAFGMAAAVLYTGSNIALRRCVGTDPFLVAAVKAAPTVVVLGPWVLGMWLAGRRLATSTRMVPRFALVALVGQIVGNAAFQTALGSIGLAATVPITLGMLIASGAVFGRVLLGEPVQRKTIAAMVTLVLAVVILSQPQASAQAVGAEAETAAGLGDSLPVWFGGLCAAAAGTAYAMFGTVLRQTLNGGVSGPATMLISGLVGAVSLWSITLARIGPETIAATDPQQWAMMTAAGVLNLSAFVALSTALKALPVVAVNLINASQVAMAAIAGVVLFSEPVTLPLVTGILLTFAGLTILASRRGGRESE